eukprot:COSAG01_NODE_61404_length_289_cov_3.231579_1_plen_22_part_10
MRPIRARPTWPTYYLPSLRRLA